MIPTLATIPRCDTHRYTLLTSDGTCPTCDALPWITSGDHDKSDYVAEQERKAHHWAKASGRMHDDPAKRRQRALLASEASRIARLAQRAWEPV